MSTPADPKPLSTPRATSVAELSISDKQVLVDILIAIRGYQALGIVEFRDWLEIIFPEFRGIRDREADVMFKRIAGSRVEEEE